MANKVSIFVIGPPVHPTGSSPRQWRRPVARNASALLNFGTARSQNPRTRTTGVGSFEPGIWCKKLLTPQPCLGAHTEAVPLRSCRKR
eukprot:7261159-Prymnesium_polylepis.1